MTDEAQHAGRQNPQPRADALTEATLHARQAPSFLNTQPWRWRQRAGTAELWLDRHRQLHGADPDGRLAMVSCGVALHHALVALRAAGHAGEVNRLDESAGPDLVAVVRIGTRCMADDRAFHALAARRTDRRPFADTPLTAADLEMLRTAAEDHGAHLWMLTPRQVPAFARSLSEARLREHIGAATAAELADWTARPDGRGDGVTPRTHSPGDPHMDPDDAGFSRTPWMALGESAATSTTYAILFTDGDRPRDWLTAGEALSGVWLTLTARGLAASPFSEVVEVPVVRASMRQLIGGAGHPMIALRIGVPHDPDTPPPPTARRSGRNIDNAPSDD